MDTSTTMNDSFNLFGTVTLMHYFIERMLKKSLDNCHDFINLKDVIRYIPSDGSVTKISLNNTDVNELGMTCKDTKINHSQKDRMKDCSNSTQN